MHRPTTNRRVGARAVLLALLAVCPGIAGAGEPGEAGPWLQPALTYDGAGLVGLKGGARTGRTYVGNLHLKLTANGDAVDWPGTSAFIDVLSIHGGRPSRIAGDAQGVSNLEGPIGTQVEELWLQHNFIGSSVSLLVGLYDLNSEFYRLQAAGLFLNSSFGIGPEFAQSGVEGPSIFPRTSIGLRVAFKPTAETVLRAALLDGVPLVRPDRSLAAFRRGDGLLAVAELALLSRAQTRSDRAAPAADRIGRFSSLAPYDRKLALGGWRYTARSRDLSDVDRAGNPQVRSGSSGAYAIGEVPLTSARARRGLLAAFAQAGVAEARSSRFASYLGAGLVGSRWGPMHDSDQFGASVARACNGSHYRLASMDPGTSRCETTVELSYLTRLSTFLTVQPDLQYVIHPDTNPATANAWVLQLRFEVTF